MRHVNVVFDIVGPKFGEFPLQLKFLVIYLYLIQNILHIFLKINSTIGEEKCLHA